MKSFPRLLLALLILSATLLLSNCGGVYGCRVTFGDSTCTPSGSGFGGSGSGGGGGGGSKPSAFTYAVDQNGTLDGYVLNTSANTFQPISSFTAPFIPASNPGVGMVVAREQFVYALFEPTDVIYGWSIDSSSGALTALSGFPVGITLNLPVVDYNQYNVATDPGGNYLFVSDTGTYQILVFAIDSTTGALTQVGLPISTSPIVPGNLATDGLGKYLYVCSDIGGHTGSGQVLAYSIGTGGALTPVTGSPFTFSAGIWELQGEASGNYLIGTTGNTKTFTGVDDDNLYVFAINQTTTPGAIAQAAGSPFVTQYSPFTIAVQPPSSGGELVYSFSVNDSALGTNPIEGYQLDTSTGALSALSESPFSNAIASGQWGQFDQSGSNLMVYNNVSTVYTDEIVSGNSTQVTPLQVGAGGVLTQPISSEPIVTPGYWVITDP